MQKIGGRRGVVAEAAAKESEAGCEVGGEGIGRFARMRARAGTFFARFLTGIVERERTDALPVHRTTARYSGSQERSPVELAAELKKARMPLYMKILDRAGAGGGENARAIIGQMIAVEQSAVGEHDSRLRSAMYGRLAALAAELENVLREGKIDGVLPDCEALKQKILDALFLEAKNRVLEKSRLNPAKSGDDEAY